MLPPSLILLGALLVQLPSLFASVSASQSDSNLETREQSNSSAHHLRTQRQKRDWGAWSSKNGQTKLSQAGVTGIGAMQMSVVDDDSILIYDKSEYNPLTVAGHSAWGSVYTISTQAVRPLNLKTNSFCAGGGWLGSGVLLSVGGNPREGPRQTPAAGNGLQGIRLFTPCGPGGTCDVYEDPAKLHLTSNRWYPSTVRLIDGSLIIMGGMTAGGFNNAPATDNPTFEFYPPKGNGQAIYSKFLHDALNTNLFPVTFALTDGTIFVAANEIAMIYNWKTNTETRLPGIPNGVRINYPSSSAAVLLPLTIANSFTPEILMCGGSTANVDGPPTALSAQTPASKQCVRMVINSAGISGGWIVEQMPHARVMGDGILTPDGKVVIVNGAGTGIAGYGNVPNEIGASNAANPVYSADIYDPLGKPGRRFSTNFPTSSIERLYHSSATLIPDGRILVAGSNPNADVSTTTYVTRYTVEILTPPYANTARPTFSKVPTNLLYGQKYKIQVKIPAGGKVITAVIMDLGYSTHGIHSSMRNVELVTSLVGSTVAVIAPSSPEIYPPGYAWLYILSDGVPSKGLRVMVGTGTISSVPVNPKGGSVKQGKKKHRHPKPPGKRL